MRIPSSIDGLHGQSQLWMTEDSHDLGNPEKIGQPKMVKPLWMTCWKFALRITKTGGWKGLELYFKVARDVSLRILRFQVFLARND